jgi:hypothetical protein
MVFGAIINWTVGKTLDLTFDTIWWLTKKTGQGIYNAGHYLIISKNKNRQFQIMEEEREKNIELDIETESEMNLENTREGLKQRYEMLKLLKEQNKLLAEEIKLLQISNQSKDEKAGKKKTD